MWAICGNKTHIFPKNSPQVPHILSMKCPPQQFPHIFPLNSQYFNQISSYFPLKNQHFVNRPPYYQWNILAYVTLIRSGEFVGNLLTWPCGLTPHIGTHQEWAICGEYVDMGMGTWGIWPQILLRHPSRVRNLWGISICWHGQNVGNMLTWGIWPQSLLRHPTKFVGNMVGAEVRSDSPCQHILNILPMSTYFPHIRYSPLNGGRQCEF